MDRHPLSKTCIPRRMRNLRSHKMYSEVFSIEDEESNCFRHHPHPGQAQMRKREKLCAISSMPWTISLRLSMGTTCRCPVTDSSHGNDNCKTVREHCHSNEIHNPRQSILLDSAATSPALSLYFSGSSTSTRPRLAQ